MDTSPCHGLTSRWQITHHRVAARKISLLPALKLQGQQALYVPLYLSIVVLQLNRQKVSRYCQISKPKQTRPHTLKPTAASLACHGQVSNTRVPSTLTFEPANPLPPQMPTYPGFFHHRAGRRKTTATWITLRCASSNIIIRFIPPDISSSPQSERSRDFDLVDIFNPQTLSGVCMPARQYAHHLAQNKTGCAISSMFPNRANPKLS